MNPYVPVANVAARRLRPLLVAGLQSALPLLMGDALRRSKRIYGRYIGRKRKRGRAAATIGRAARGYLRKVGYYGRYSGSPGQEVKFRDTNLDLQFGVAGFVSDAFMPDISQGTGESNRIGRYIKIKKIMMRYTIEIEPDTTPALAPCTIRMMIILDTQCNGSSTNVGDLLEAPAFIRSFNNMSNSGRFRVLADKYTTMNPSNFDLTTTTLARSGFWSYNKPILIEYSGTTGVLAEQRSNHVYIMLYADQALRARLLATIRYRFCDGK